MEADPPNMGAPDTWAQWVLAKQFGATGTRTGSPPELHVRFREKVLKGAAISPGDTVLDVGSGAGLVAFGAAEQVGPEGMVILSDISQPLLDHSRSVAESLNIVDRCRFVRASAENLAPIADRSVDAVTARSVLIYVEEKAAAFREFHRVLRPGGRISLFEPINRYNREFFRQTFCGFNIEPVSEIAHKVKEVYERLEATRLLPMLNFDEHDLLRLAEEASFTEVHLELQVDITPMQPQDWATFLKTAPNPLAPSPEEAMASALQPDEVVLFTEYLRPLVESGEGISKSAGAYLWASNISPVSSKALPVSR